MGFLSSLFSGREIARLEELVENSPAPSLFMRLAQLYRENGDDDKAREITLRGAKMFPESEALGRAQADAQKIKNDAERRRLLAKIEQYPSPVLYARLAKLYLKDKDIAAAEKICRDGCRSYPDYGGLWASMGEIAIHRGDLVTATENLEKAATLDKYNYNGMMMLAETYLRRGMRDEGRATLLKILEFSPADEKVTAFIAEFDERAQALEQEAAQATDVRTPGGKDTGADAPPGKISGNEEAQGMQDKKTSGVGTSLHKEIRQIRRVDGVRGTVLIDPAGLVIASDLPESVDEDLSAALITSICRTVTGASAELKLGEFEDGIVDTDNGCIHIMVLDQMTMGVFAAAQTKAGLLQRSIHTFAQRVIEAYH